MTRGTPWFVALFIVCACSLALAGPALAATINVNTNTDELNADGDCALREAVQATNTNASVDACTHDAGTGADTIVLQNATSYELNGLLGAGEDNNATGDLDVNAGTGGLTFDGAANTSVIDGAGNDRVLHLQAGPVTVEGTTISGGVVTGSGGGILTQGNASLDLTGSGVFLNDATNGGGGIQISSPGGATITDSGVNNNDATAGSGGGINVSSTAAASPLTIDNSTIQNNTATESVAFGGGIFYQPNSASTLAISDSLIDDNTATGSLISRGGGVHIPAPSGGTVTVDRSIISDNDSVGTATASAGGAGIQFNGPSGTITDSVISGNSGTVAAGGALNAGAGVLIVNNTVRIVRSTVSGNTANTGVASGAGIRNEATLALLNSTVSGNQSGTGAGLEQADNSSTVVNTTFSNNVASGIGDAIQQSLGTVTVRASVIDNANTADACSGTVTSGNFNVAVGTSCGLAMSQDEQNANPLLGILFDNGGPDAGPTGNTEPVRTHLPGLASTVLEQVPAANCTDDGGVNPLTVDQGGFPRPFDSDDTGGADCEAGSVEVFQCNNTPATHIGTPGDDVINGGVTADVIVGAGGTDTLNGGGSADRICGNEGNDVLDGGGVDAADQYDGGPGTDDEVTFAAYAGDIFANLTTGTATNLATIEPGTVENLRGGSGGNSFIGDGADNELRGGGGDDNLIGEDGADLLDGQSNGVDGDSTTFPNAVSPIVASLQAGTATGQGSDMLINLENLRGGPNNDNLTGDGGVNLVEGASGNDTITGLGGMDDLQGEGNDDSIFARDGVQDDVDCSGGADFVQADATGVDLIDPTCETVDFFVPPVVTPPTTPPAAPSPTQARVPKKCKKGQKLKKGKCVKKRKKRK